MKMTDISVVLWQEHRRTGLTIVAQAMDFDFQGTGPTLTAAFENLGQQIKQRMEFNQMMGQPAFWEIQPADPRHWATLRHGGRPGWIRIFHPDDSTGMESQMDEAG